ncbi:MAG: PH domain-containing protein [Clostridia bacterium]|nr:PH domain-containing protein [Clostridia bacterium]
MAVKLKITAHPIMIFYYLKPFWFVLIIPLIKAIVSAVIKAEVNNVLLNELFISVVLITYSVIKWKKLKINISSDFIEIYLGVVRRRYANIPINKISTIETTKSPLDYIFGTQKVKINTEAGKQGSADFWFKLNVGDVKKVTELYPEKVTPKTIKFSAVRVAVMAATSSSAFTGIVLVVPIINQAVRLLGTAVTDLLLDRINKIGQLFSKFMPPVVNTVTVVFLISYFIAFLISFFKSVNFKVVFAGKKTGVFSGLLVLRKVLFNTKSVNSVCIEQTPLMRFFARYLLRVGIGGYGNRKGDRAVVVPSAKRDEVHELFSVLFPKFEPADNKIKPHKNTRWRFYYLPTLFLAVSVILYLVLSYSFPVFKGLISFGFIVTACVLAYYYSLAEYNTKHSCISVAPVIYANYTRWSATREMFCEHNRIGIIHITRWPVDKRKNTCNVRLTVRSEAAESITVKHISYNELTDEIKSLYQI